MTVPNYLEDPDFLDGLLSFIIRDRHFLRSFGHILTTEDFKPRSGDPAGRDRWIIATKALEHWNAYRDAIFPVLAVTLKEHATLSRLGAKRTAELLSYAKAMATRKLVAPKAIADKLLEWKRQSLMMTSIEELIDAQGSGELSTERFLEISRKAVALDTSMIQEEREFFETLEERIIRRETTEDLRYPALFIEPFDALVRAIAKGQLGCVLAPYKRGKSMFLLHIALAYVLQRLRVIYITLEDPKEEVEDRLDAAITALPIRELRSMQNKIRRNFQQFTRLAKGRLKIIDGTENGVSVADIEQIWLREREQGFTADCVIVDYDDEILPPKQHRDNRRFEFADIYRELRKFAARNKLLVWTAAQSQRKTGDIKTLGGDHLAEDVSKARKVSCMLALGKGDWGPDSIYLHVAAHKFDKQNVGCNLMTDRTRMLIYDRQATLQEMRRAAKSASSAARATAGVS